MDNQAVVATFCKLQPAELLHYLDNLHRYPKATLIRHVRQAHPGFEQDTETLTNAMIRIDLERLGEAGADNRMFSLGRRRGLAPLSRVEVCIGGGILDWDDSESEEDVLGIGEMTGFGLDWRPEDPFRPREDSPLGIMDP